MGSLLYKRESFGSINGKEYFDKLTTRNVDFFFIYVIQTWS
jgi:hypothetical protein